jgi:hypothetical protein
MDTHGLGRPWGLEEMEDTPVDRHLTLPTVPEKNQWRWL